MGNALHRNYENLSKKVSVKRYINCWKKKPVCGVVMLSLDAVGKTTMLYNLIQDVIIDTIPSIGFNIERMEFEHNQLEIWEVGGGCMIRKLWHHYLPQKKVIVFVIDLSDEQRLGEALILLETQILDKEQSKGKELFIIGNKKDIAKPNMIEELERRVTAMKIEHSHRIRHVCSLHRADLLEVFQQMSSLFAPKQ